MKAKLAHLYTTGFAIATLAGATVQTAQAAPVAARAKSTLTVTEQTSITKKLQALYTAQEQLIAQLKARNNLAETIDSPNFPKAGSGSSLPTIGLKIKEEQINKSRGTVIDNGIAVRNQLWGIASDNKLNEQTAQFLSITDTQGKEIEILIEAEKMRQTVKERNGTNYIPGDSVRIGAADRAVQLKYNLIVAEKQFAAQVSAFGKAYRKIKLDGNANDNAGLTLGY